MLIVPHTRRNIVLSDAEMAAILQAVPRDASAENQFLSDIRFVPGVATTEAGRAVDPQESLAEYQRVLSQIKRVDPARFAQMHKGTPYYLMGWLAYSSRDYESGVFYVDAALSEDHANDPNWQNTPAAAFILLNPNHPNAAANHIVAEIRSEMDAQVGRYAALAGTPFTTGDLVGRFIRPSAHDSTHRSLVTALLTFTLEGQQRLLQMDVRSGHGGTLEPFLTHLFKGGLILESILKRFHHGEKISKGKKAMTMGQYLSLPNTRLDLQLALPQHLYQKLVPPFTLTDVLTALPTWRTQPLPERAIAIAYGIRNTSGHDLGWPASFDTGVYRELHEGLIDAVLWTIEKKYP